MTAACVSGSPQPENVTEDGPADDGDDLHAAPESAGVGLVRRRLLAAPIGELDGATREAMIATALDASMECGKGCGSPGEPRSDA